MTIKSIINSISRIFSERSKTSFGNGLVEPKSALGLGDPRTFQKGVLRSDDTKNFWQKLPKPFFVLAPMADVTDAAFRRIIAKHGKPDVFFTEFVSADGLCSPGREVLLKDFMYSEAEHPIVAQIFGSNPENIKKAAKLCKDLGFDGIDINMGCPDKSIEKQGAGAAMMKDAKRAREIIRAAKEGGEGLPISVKTRIGYNKNELETWLPELLAEDLAALTIHARTRKEMSLVPARWEHVKEAVEIRDRMGKNTLIIGNGDVKDLNDARQKVKETGCDGVMLGRAIFGNPWLFSALQNSFPEGPRVAHATFSEKSGLDQTVSEEGFASLMKTKLRVMTEHTKLFEELLGDVKSFAIMKKHYKAYVNGFDGAKELRVKLMEAENSKEIEEIVNDFLKAS
ncbi:MAG: tRNA-dihydrouridine synthase [Candidatus Paceibacterota bacterium]|jgi:nifR3 family TIM-barrel protein